MRMIFAATALPLTAVVALSAAGAMSQSPTTAALEKAVAAPTRPANAVARDQYRHPVQTLSFFGIKPTDTVVEIWPGGGWYTQILAPYLHAKGTLYEVAPMPNGLNGIEKLKAAHPAVYGFIHTAAFPAEAGQAGVPDGSADVVLTFRNVHNWRMGYQQKGVDYAPQAFAQMYAMLKPGGILGVVDHRLPENADTAREQSSGYVKVSTVRKLAEDAGFQFVGASQVNANPKDDANHPKGVWTLPPTYALGDTDRAKYAAIGESDRMTLKFRKPK